jgi:hypothetical protein
MEMGRLRIFSKGEIPSQKASENWPDDLPKGVVGILATSRCSHEKKARIMRVFFIGARSKRL